MPKRAIHSGITPPAISHPAGLTKAEVSPSLFTPLSPSLFTPHKILYRASLMRSETGIGVLRPYFRSRVLCAFPFQTTLVLISANEILKRKCRPMNSNGRSEQKFFFHTLGMERTFFRPFFLFSNGRPCRRFTAHQAN